MVTEGLGLQPPDDDDFSLITEAIVMFLSYGGFGSIPLIVYYLGHSSMSVNHCFGTAAIATGLTLCILGSSKSSFSSSPWYYCATESVLFGVFCAVISYTVGSSLVGAMGVR
jgi:vacuolar iron transporter family protein